MEPVIYVRDLLAGLTVPWFLCGGWAADVWLGRQTRPHLDVDIAVRHDDQRAIFEHLPGWELVAHDPHVPDDTTERWDGRHLDPPAHVHAFKARNDSAYEFEFLLSERSAEELERFSAPSPLGLRAFLPELVLFYKAGGEHRPQDDDDFAALLPTLNEAQRRWLRGAIAEAHPGDPWLARLGEPAPDRSMIMPT